MIFLWPGIEHYSLQAILLSCKCYRQNIDSILFDELEAGIMCCRFANAFKCSLISFISKDALFLAVKHTYYITVTFVEHHGVAIHRQIECLFNSLFRQACATGPLWGDCIGDRRIPLIKCQWCGKCFHVITSLWTRNVQSVTNEISHWELRVKTKLGHISIYLLISQEKCLYRYDKTLHMKRLLSLAETCLTW